MRASRPAGTPAGPQPRGRRLGVAASTAVAAHLDRPGTGTVLLCGRLAAYLAVDDDVLAVVAAGAVAPPGSVVLPPGLRPDEVLGAGDAVAVGSGGLLVRPDGPARLLLQPARWWQPAQVRAGRLDPSARDAVVTGLAVLPDPPPEVARARAGGHRAAAALVAGAVDEATAELCAVLGLGPGTTPSGDDVAAGLLLAARALLSSSARDGAERLGTAVVAAARTRTGCVSRAMLADARLGRAPALVVDLVDALAGQGDAATALDRLLALGHHSGADLACGAAAVAVHAGRQPATRGAP